MVIFLEDKLREESSDLEMGTRQRESVVNPNLWRRGASWIASGFGVTRTPCQGVLSGNYTAVQPVVLGKRPEDLLSVAFVDQVTEESSAQKMASMEEEINQLRKQLDEVMRDRDAVVQEKDEQLASARRELEEVKQERDALEEEKFELLASAMWQQEEEVKEAGNDLSRQKDQMLAATMCELEEMKDIRDSLEQLVSSLTEQLRSSKQEVKSLLSARKRDRAEMQQLTAHLEKVLDDEKWHCKDLVSKQQQIQQLSEDLQEKSKINCRLEKELQKMQCVAAELQKERGGRQENVKEE
ncbi:M protein, serotype 6 [Amia ocellicauda]|uniref:M protein, serotype 6 n=1 Tax=Amia ocellicauda TaxID=2972642 RepID=UPI0034646991